MFKVAAAECLDTIQILNSFPVKFCYMIRLEFYFKFQSFPPFKIKVTKPIYIYMCVCVCVCLRARRVYIYIYIYIATSLVV